MQFVKLGSSYYLDLAVMQISEAAEVAFVRSIAWVGNAETSGLIPAAALPVIVKRHSPAKARKVIAELVASQLWVEAEGGWRLRTWTKHQSELEALLKRRRSDAERQQRQRDKVAASREPSREPSRDESRISLSRESEVTDKEEVQNPDQLTVVCRLISGNAQATTTDDVVARWQKRAGPGVDLETEAEAFLDFNAGTTVDSYVRAWLGWLNKARERAAAGPRHVPACHRCNGTGWDGEDEHDRPIRCQCRTVTPITSAPSAGVA